MSVRLARAASFLAGHGRLLDRRRFAHLVGAAGPEPVLAALDGYRNADGGYGWGVEPVESRPHAIALAFAVRFLDAAAPRYPNATALLTNLSRFVPRRGTLPVEGGLEGESMRPLDFVPVPGGPAAVLIAPDALQTELDTLATRQQLDGGWPVDFASHSPQATLEWRAYTTVNALRTLHNTDRLQELQQPEPQNRKTNQTQPSHRTVGVAGVAPAE